MESRTLLMHHPTGVGVASSWVVAGVLLLVAWVDRGRWCRDKVDAFVGSLVLASFLKKVLEAVYVRY